MLFYLKNSSLPRLMHIHENEILPVKLPTVRMECNGCDDALSQVGQLSVTSMRVCTQYWFTLDRLSAKVNV